MKLFKRLKRTDKVIEESEKSLSNTFTVLSRNAAFELINTFIKDYNLDCFNEIKAREIVENKFRNLSQELLFEVHESIIKNDKIIVLPIDIGGIKICTEKELKVFSDVFKKLRE